jgi:hypothetical protein
MILRRGWRNGPGFLRNRWADGAETGVGRKGKQRARGPFSLSRTKRSASPLLPLSFTTGRLLRRGVHFPTRAERWGIGGPCDVSHYPLAAYVAGAIPQPRAEAGVLLPLRIDQRPGLAHQSLEHRVFSSLFASQVFASSFLPRRRYAIANTGIVARLRSPRARRGAGRTCPPAPPGRPPEPDRAVAPFRPNCCPSGFPIPLPARRGNCGTGPPRFHRRVSLLSPDLRRRVAS